MAPRTINQRIAVQGGPEVARQLSDMARAGQEAFAKIRQAAEQTKNIKLPVEEIKKQLVEVGQAGQKAFQQVGEGATRASAPVKEQAGFFSSLTGRITVAAAAVVGLATAYAAMANSASQAVVALGRQADAAKLSITNFQNLRGALGQLGLTQDESVTAANKLREAVTKAFDEGKKSLEKFGIRFPPVQDNIERLGKSFEAFSQQTLSSEAASRSIAQSITILGTSSTNTKTLLSETSRILLSMGAVVNALTGKVRDGADAWFPFAQGIRAISDEGKQATIVNKIFGEDIGRVLLPAIRKGNEEFARALGSIRSLNLGFTEAERKVGQDFVNAWERLTLATKQSRTEMGLAFAPLFTPGINLLADALRQNRSLIAGFAADINKVLGPAIAQLFGFLSRQLDTPGSFDGLRDGLISFGTAVKNIVVNVVIPAFTTLKNIATEVATGLSDVFGANISPALVAIGAIAVSLLGPFNALAVAVAAVFGGTGPLFDAFREKLKTIGIDIVAIGTQIKDFAVSIFNDLKAIFEGRLGDVKNTELIQLKEVLVEIATSVPAIVLAVVAGVLVMRRAFGGLAMAINAVFGTSLTAGGLAAIAIAGSVSGAFTALAAVLIAVGAALGIVLTTLKIIGVVIAGVAAFFAIPVAAATALVAAIVAAGVAIFLFRDQIITAFASAWASVVAGAAALPGLIVSALSGLADILTAPFRIAAGIIRGIWQSLLEFIKSVIAAASQSPTERGSVGGNIPGDPGAPFARGGYTGSIGSRRIAGFVHGNEYVEPAHVVRQPGVLAFLEMLRRMGGDLEATIARFSRGYSMGGFVERLNSSLSQLAIPSFASGGFAEAIPARAGRDLGTVRLDFGGGQRFTVMSDESTVDSLQRFAVRRHTLSAGKKYGN